MKNTSMFSVNPTNEFHVLRHFKFVESSYKKTLVNQEYWYYDYAQQRFLLGKISEVDIENALHTIGTKFEKNIPGIETPKELLKVIERECLLLAASNRINWTYRDEHASAMFTFEYTCEVGKTDCISIDTIPEKERKKIVNTLRSKCRGENAILVHTISEIPLPATKTIHVEIVETKQLPFYMISAFPDCPLANDVPIDKLVFVV